MYVRIRALQFELGMSNGELLRLAREVSLRGSLVAIELMTGSALAELARLLEIIQERTERGLLKAA